MKAKNTKLEVAYNVEKKKMGQASHRSSKKMEIGTVKHGNQMNWNKQVIAV